LVMRIENRAVIQNVAWMHCRQLSLLAVMVLCLAPGAAGALAYIALASPIQAAGYPPLAALLVAITVVIIPVELAILLVARSRAWDAEEPLIPFRVPMSPRSWAWLVPALLVAAVLGSGILMFADALVARGLFSWLPRWYLQPIGLDLVGSYSKTSWT
jgi:hypothetical protein